MNQVLFKYKQNRQGTVKGPIDPTLQQLKESAKSIFDDLQQIDVGKIILSYKETDNMFVQISSDEQYLRIVENIKRNGVKKAIFNIDYVEQDEDSELQPSSDEQQQEQVQQDNQDDGFDSNEEMNGSIQESNPQNRINQNADLDSDSIQEQYQRSDQENVQQQVQEATPVENISDDSEQDKPPAQEEDSEQEHVQSQEQDEQQQQEQQKEEKTNTEHEQQNKLQKQSEDNSNESEQSDESSSELQQSSPQQDDPPAPAVQPMADSQQQNDSEQSPNDQQQNQAEQDQEQTHSASNQTQLPQLKTMPTKVKQTKNEDSVKNNTELVSIKQYNPQFKIDNGQISEIKKPGDSCNQSENRSDENMLEKIKNQSVICQLQKTLQEMQKTMLLMQQRIEKMEKQREIQKEVVFTACNGCGLLKSRGERKKAGNTLLSIFFCPQCDDKYEVTPRSNDKL